MELCYLTSAAYTSRNQEYMAGPDNLNNAETVDRFVYERNHEAYELLGITVEYTNGSGYAWGTAHSTIVNAINNTNSTIAPDMYVNMMYGMVGASLSGVFRDILSIRGSYFDFEQQGWLYSIMSDLSFSRERAYLLVSDYFFDTIRNLMVMPFNLAMIDDGDTNAELVAALAGSEFESGSRLSDYLFDIVRDGKWTFDKLIEVCEAVYVDEDAATGDSAGDILGLYIDATGGNAASAFLYSSDVTFFTETTDANGGVTALAYPANGDTMNAVFQAVDRLMKAEGTQVVDGSLGTNSANTMLRAYFAEGRVFTDGVELLGNFETAVYQIDMRDTFSVVPIPLLVEGEDSDAYNTLVHNTAMVGGININSAKYLAISAFVQYCTEHEKTQELKEEYLEGAMKYELVDYNPGTDDMLSLIYDNIDSCRDMIIDNIVYQQGGLSARDLGVTDIRWHGYMRTDNYGNAANFLSVYEALRSAKQAVVDTLLATWYTLPKVTE